MSWILLRLNIQTPACIRLQMVHLYHLISVLLNGPLRAGASFIRSECLSGSKVSTFSSQKASLYFSAGVIVGGHQGVQVHKLVDHFDFITVVMNSWRKVHVIFSGSFLFMYFVIDALLVSPFLFAPAFSLHGGKYIVSHFFCASNNLTIQYICCRFYARGKG